MNHNIKQKAEILRKEQIAPEIYSMTFGVELAVPAEPGQFVMVYPPDGARLLGRPLCVADASDQTLRIVFRAAGGGTSRIASCDPGDMLYLGGAFGKGYPYDSKTTGGRETVLLCGGLGAPSLLFLAKRLSEAGHGAHCTAFLGYRDSSLMHFLADDFISCGIKVVISTDDGSEGVRGNVLDAVKETGVAPGLIYACGPLPMLSAVKKYSCEKKIPAYISLEEHMACGIGVCLGCVVRTEERDPHSNVHNARICTEGPVFEASEVRI